MTTMRSIIILLIASLFFGCSKDPKYGTEARIGIPGSQAEVWAIAPAVNLSGMQQVDVVVQADLLYAQLQQIKGLTVIPVNRVIEVYNALRIEKIETPQQANLVCDLLGCQALVVPTVTAYDPYNPPKFGASLQWFAKPGAFVRPQTIDARELAMQSRGDPGASLPQFADYLQAVGMYDAANGSTREAVLKYAAGRQDPLGPMGTKEYFASMDRYVGFCYFNLANDLLNQRRELMPQEKK